MKTNDRTISVSRRGALGGLAAVGAATATLVTTSAASAEDRPAGKFSERSVIVTGATSGIGRQAVLAFAREGGKVAFNGRRNELGREVAAQINADQAVRASGGSAFYHQSDVRDETQVQAFVAAAVERHGGLDVAYNNAGVVFGNGDLRGNKPLADVTSADFDDVLRTNMRGLFLSMKYEIPHLLRNDPYGRFGHRGTIINCASVSAHGGFPGIGPYSVSKHAVLGLTRGASLDYGGQGIRVVSISPGGVDTPMRRASIEAQGNDPDEATAPNIQHRTNTEEEMADVLLFLASPDTPSPIQGTDIDVTMGMLTGPFAPPNRNA